jgi:adenylate cyclase
MGQVPFHVGIGLDSGEVIVGNMGSSMRMEYTAVGEAVNMASRLSSMARGGEILINGELYASLQGMVVAEALTDTVIKGIDRPVKLYNIVELKGGWKSEVEDFVEEETERLVTDGMVP